VAQADLGSGSEAFVGVGGRHLDVDDDQVGASSFDEAQQLGGVTGLAGDLEAGLGEQAREPLA
jgi:hypothetical protein